MAAVTHAPVGAAALVELEGVLRAYSGAQAVYPRRPRYLDPGLLPSPAQVRLTLRGIAWAMEKMA
jgi:hypothetical protein